MSTQTSQQQQQQQQPNLTLLNDADSIIREYLVWRGFNSALEAFAKDLKEDALQGLSSKRLVQNLVLDLESLNYTRMFLWWDEGIAPLLSRVNEEVAAVGRGLRDSTYRWYLIVCFKQQRNDLILSFFKDHWANRVGSTRFREEWKKQWFSLPYTTNPERDRYFSVYFTTEWRNVLISSLETYLNAILTAIPPPRLIALASVGDTLESLRLEIQVLKMHQMKDIDSSTFLKPTIHQETDLSAIKEVVSTLEEKKKEDEDLERTLNRTSSFVNASSAEQQQQLLIGKRKGEILRVRYSPSCLFVAGCGRDATAVIWPSNNDAANSSQKNPRLLCDSTCSSLDWFDDNLLCVGTLDHSIHIWTPPNSNGVTSKVNTIRMTQNLPWVLDVAFDPSSSSGSQLVVSVAPAIESLPGEVQLWNLNTEKLDRCLLVEPVASRFHALRFNHNGSLLVTGSSDGMLRVFDSSRSNAIMGWPSFTNGPGVSALCLSSSETSIYALSSDGRTVVEWSLHRVGEALKKISIEPSLFPSAEKFKGKMGGDIAVSGNRLAVAFGGVVSVYEDGNLKNLSCPSNISCVDWDENNLICGGIDGTICRMTL